MKKTFYTLYVCFFSLLPLFAACTNDEDYPHVDFEKSLLQEQTKEKWWEGTLNKVITMVTRSTPEELCLLEYNHYKNITSVKELDDVLENEIFADTSLIALQNYKDFSYKIYTIKDIKESTHDSIRTRVNFEELQDEIRTTFKLYFENKGTATILKLKYSYQGKIIYSTAIASNGHKVFFETIGYLIINKNQKIDEEIPVAFLEIKNRSENTPPGGHIDRFLKQPSEENFLGLTVFECYLFCRSEFNDQGILIDRESNVKYETYIGYNGSAGIEFISGTPFQSSHNEFAWAWAYGFGSSFTFSFAGTGFTIQGADRSDSGSVTHSYLKKDETSL